MIKHYKHVIWDWNGTILNDVDLCVDLINWLLKPRGLKTISTEAYKNVFTIPVKDYYADLGFNFAKESFEIVGRIWMDEYERRKFECSLFPSIVGVLDKISKLNIGQSILSAYTQHTLDDLVVHYGLRNYFTHVVGLDNIYAASKLHLGRELIKKLHDIKDRVVVIGDTIHDFEVAKDIGADCILVSNGHQSKEKLLSCGVLVLNDIKEIIV
jgi:phosphoglycolate phosphatase